MNNNGATNHWNPSPATHEDRGCTRLCGGSMAAGAGASHGFWPGLSMLLLRCWAQRVSLGCLSYPRMSHQETAAGVIWMLVAPTNLCPH